MNLQSRTQRSNFDIARASHEVLMNGRWMRVMAAAIVLTASAVLMAGARPAGRRPVW
jgi:hypothetical protein